MTKRGKRSQLVEFPEHLKAQIDTYSYMVRTGKPAAMIPVQRRFIDSAVERINTAHSGLQTCVEDLSNGWITLWIYKYQHIFEVIRSVPQAPKTTFDHWVLGKLFGYSEDSIAEFLANRL